MRFVIEVCSLIYSSTLLQVVYRVIQIVVNRQDVQDYAAKTVFEVLLFGFDEFPSLNSHSGTT